MLVRDYDIKTLAETLHKSGLAASATEAARMAHSIVKTEKRVATDFDRKKEQEDQKIERKRYNNKQEEIDDLIERTSFEKKDFYVPISGYHVERKVENIISQPDVGASPVNVETDQPAGTLTNESDSKIPETIDSNDNLELEIVDLPVKSENEPSENTNIEPVDKNEPKAEEIKPVFTDAIDDDRTLKEIMEEDAADVYKNNDEEFILPAAREEEVSDVEGSSDDTSEYNIVTFDREQEESNLKATESEEYATEEEPDVLLSNDSRQPEPVVIEPEKPKEFKNPIPKVDLSQHFNFARR